MRRTQVVVPLVGLTLLPILFSTPVRAHCPLCSAGAGGAAAIASALGIGLAVVGVFVGAFGVATGIWTARHIDGQYLPYQDRLVALAVALTIVVPVLPIMNETTAVFVSIIGEYGSPLNRTYLINTYLVGALVGAGITSATPQISALISRIRGSTIPFQGLALTFILLGAASWFLEVSL